MRGGQRINYLFLILLVSTRIVCVYTYICVIIYIISVYLNIGIYTLVSFLMRKRTLLGGGHERD